ncbi:MAG: hypothetical protein ACKV0T_04750 [Planctomycetales bacterium]
MHPEAAKSRYVVTRRGGYVGAKDPPVYVFPLCDTDATQVERLTANVFAANLINNAEAAWKDRLGEKTSISAAESALIKEWSTYRPVAIVESAGQIWWKCVPRVSPLPEEYFLLGARTGSDGICARLEKAGFSDARELAHFVDLMSGYREEFPAIDGTVPDWDTDHWMLEEAKLLSFLGDFRLGAKWDPSFILFSAACGDVLVVNRQGQCGWWADGTDDGINLFANTLEMAMSRWIFHWRLVRENAERIGLDYYPFGAFGYPY